MCVYIIWAIGVHSVRGVVIFSAKSDCREWWKDDAACFWGGLTGSVIVLSLFDESELKSWDCGSCERVRLELAHHNVRVLKIPTIELAAMILLKIWFFLAVCYMRASWKWWYEWLLRIFENVRWKKSYRYSRLCWKINVISQKTKRHLEHSWLIQCW